jgi:1-acyl-sn-glycerol-3-phosphate acyltransferase
MHLFYEITRRVLHLTYSVLYRHQVEWEMDPKTIPAGAIIAPNHVSYLDPQLVCGSWPGDLTFFAGSRLFKYPILGRVLRLLRCHPVEKGKELATIRAAIGILREGRRVVVFPEGTRSNDGDLKPFRDGVAFLALQSRCPIIPCYVGGTYEAWPRSQKWPRLRGVRTVCRFGPPIWPVDASGNPVAKERLNALLSEEISRLARVYK